MQFKVELVSIVRQASTKRYLVLMCLYVYSCTHVQRSIKECEK